MKKDKFAELERIFGTRNPIIGMVHLAPLPGSPRYEGMSMAEITRLAINDAQTLVAGGINAAIIENFGDMMFEKRVHPETIAAITYAATKIAEAVPELTLGICVLQSDAIASLSIARIVGAKFVRIPYYTETYIVDAGMMDSVAAEALRYRAYRNLDIKIFADVHIKHGYPLSQRPIGQAARDCEHRGLADAILVTGLETGGETDPTDVMEVKKAVDATPVIVASGVDVNNVTAYKDFADGVIVGTSLKVDGDNDEPIDLTRVSAFMKASAAIWKE